MATASRPPIGEPVLDEFKKEVIIRLATEGLSRRSAARVVGCAASTITRTARRDPEFGAELALAEETLKLSALQTLGRVVAQDKYWRAAAWVAERLVPERFGRRRPQEVSTDETEDLFREMGAALLDNAPVQDRRGAAEKIARLLNELNESEGHFTADDFLADVSGAEAEAPEHAAAQTPATKVDEVSAAASSQAETRRTPPVGTAGKPSVQRSPHTYYDSSPSPRPASPLMEAASAFFERPGRATDILGHCTDASVARGDGQSNVGRKARSKGKKRPR